MHEETIEGCRGLKCHHHAIQGHLLIISSESWCLWQERLAGPARASIRATSQQGDRLPPTGPVLLPERGPKPVAIQRSGASHTKIYVPLLILPNCSKSENSILG